MVPAVSRSRTATSTGHLDTGRKKTTNERATRAVLLLSHNVYLRIGTFGTDDSCDVMLEHDCCPREPPPPLLSCWVSQTP